MTRTPVTGDKVRVYGHAYNEVPDGFVGIYSKPWAGWDGNHVVDTPDFNSSSSNIGRLFDRVELVEDDAVSFKAGDKVNAFDHVYGAYSDEEGQEATYVAYEPNGRHPDAPHVVNLKKWGTLRLNFKRVEAVVQTVEDYKLKVMLPILDREVEERDFDKDEYERLLKALGITRPLPDLPTGKNALVEGKSLNIYRLSDGIDRNSWIDTAGDVYGKAHVQQDYKRTIFEGEK